MANKFYLINRETGDRWKPNKLDYEDNFLIMYSSGNVAEVKISSFTYIVPIDSSKWQLVTKPNFLNLVKEIFNQ